MEKLLPIAEFSPLWPYPSGVGSVIGCFVIIWIMNWALNSAIFGRNWQIVKVHIDVQTAEPENKKFTLLNEMTEEVTIPTTLLQHFTRRQLNGLMKSTSFIPPITVNPYVSPFHLYKNSIKLKFKHLSDGLPVFDLSLRFDCQVSCDVELYTSVGHEAITKLFQKVSETAKARFTNTGIAPTDSDFHLIPVVGELQTPCSPTSPLSSNPDTAVEKLQYKSFSRKSSSHTKKNKCDIVFSDVIFLGEGVNESTRKEASLGPNYAELLLNEIKNGKSPNRLPFVIVLKPSHTSESTLPMFFKNELQGNINIADSICVCLIWGKVVPILAEPPIANETVSSKTQEIPLTSTTYEFIQESIKLIYHCPKATSSISKYIWLEHEEIFGSSSSNQDLSTQPSEGTAATTEFEPTSQLCVICLSDPAQVIVQPCRHCCTCIECWRLDSTVQVVNSTSAGSNVPSTPQSPQNPEVDKVTERISVKWTTCPVCRGSVEGWVEMNDTVHLKFKQSVPSE